MVKRSFLLILLLLISTNFYSQLSYDTLTVKDVASGVKYYNLRETTKPWLIYVIEVDLKNEHIKIESAKATNKVTGNEFVSTISQNNSYANHQVVGAINGDFFDGNGVSTGHQIVNGELVSGVQFNNWSKIAFGMDNKPFIERFNLRGNVYIKSDSRTLNSTNTVRNENYLVLYNRFKGNSTGTNQWGTELLIKPIDEWAVNDTVKCEVMKVEKGIGNMVIPENHAVLSGHGQSEQFISSISVGDTIGIKVGMTPLDNFKLLQMISGFPLIVRNGTNYALQGYAAEGGSATFATDRHPRTAAGFNADSTKLFLFVVDGRQATSVGVSLPELANIMLMFGVHTGLNLDGGGSSTMVVKNQVVNSPSGGPQRAVSNALLVVSSEQTVIENVVLIPDTAVTNISTPIKFYFESYDSYGDRHYFSFDDVTFINSNPNIGYVENGMFYPTDNGNTTVELILQNGQDQSRITVEEHHGNILLDGFEESQLWSFTSDKLDTNKSSISYSQESVSEGSKAIKLDYSFTYQSGQYHWAYLNTDIPIDGVPESIEIDAKGDGQNHTIAFIVSDENNEKWALLVNKSPGQDNFETLKAKLNSPIDIEQVNGKFYYPIRIKQIAISLGSSKQNGQLYEGSILFDKLVVNYPELVSVDSESNLVTDFVLEQNYPNPFNPTTVIEFSLPENYFVELSVFNSLGEQVENLISNEMSAGKHSIVFNAKSLPSGIYFYRLKAGSERLVKRMILLK